MALNTNNFKKLLAHNIVWYPVSVHMHYKTGLSLIFCRLQNTQVKVFVWSLYFLIGTYKGKLIRAKDSVGNARTWSIGILTSTREET